MWSVHGGATLQQACLTGASRFKARSSTCRLCLQPCRTTNLFCGGEAGFWHLPAAHVNFVAACSGTRTTPRNLARGSTLVYCSDQCHTQGLVCCLLPRALASPRTEHRTKHLLLLLFVLPRLQATEKYQALVEYNQLALEDLEERLAAVRPRSRPCLKYPSPTTTVERKHASQVCIHMRQLTIVQVPFLVPKLATRTAAAANSTLILAVERADKAAVSGASLCHLVNHASRRLSGRLCAFLRCSTVGRSLRLACVIDTRRPSKPNNRSSHAVQHTARQTSVFPCPLTPPTHPSPVRVRATSPCLPEQGGRRRPPCSLQHRPPARADNEGGQKIN